MSSTNNLRFAVKHLYKQVRELLLSYLEKVNALIESNNG